MRAKRPLALGDNMLGNLLDAKRLLGDGPTIPSTSTCEPLTPEQIERLYYDWRSRSDIKCENSWYQIRARKIIDEVNLRLEERRDKLRELLDRERTRTLLACEEKLHAMEISRKEGIIKEAARIKELIKHKNEEIAQREAKRQFKISCDEYRGCRSKLHRLEIAKDQKAINKFNEDRKAYERERSAVVERGGAGFTLKITEDDAVRSQKRPVEARETQKFILSQMAEHDNKKEALAKEKAREQADCEMCREKEAARERHEIEKAQEARCKLRNKIEQQIREKHRKIKEKEAKDAEFDGFLSGCWRPAPKEDNRRERNRLLNRESKFFLAHQQQIRDHRKCLDEARDRKCAETEEQQQQEIREREAAKRSFLHRLNKETFEAHRAGAEEKRKREAAAKALDHAETAKMLEEMRIWEEKREAQLKAKTTERQAIQASFMHQLEIRRQLRLDADRKMEEEREGFRHAEKEYLGRVQEVADEEKVLNQVRLHPWRRRALGIPMDKKLL